MANQDRRACKQQGLVTELEEGQFIEVPDDEDEENWPDLDAPCMGEEVGEPSKSTGKEGDQPAPQAKGNPNPEPPVQAEGGATATPAAGPNPAITAPPQDPTDELQDPQASTSTDDPGLKEYVDSYMQAAKDWFDNIQNDKVKVIHGDLRHTFADRETPHKGIRTGRW